MNDGNGSVSVEIEQLIDAFDTYVEPQLGAASPEVCMEFGRWLEVRASALATVTTL